MCGICHMTRMFAALGITLAALPLGSFADTIRVPGDQPTIQAGIDAAVDGDVVLIADGVYTGSGNKNLDFGGKAITVRGENGRDNCIIDCEQDGRGFYFHSGEGADSVVEELTIRNGRVQEGSPGSAGGGGILCIGSSPTIKGCTFTQCNANDSVAGAVGGGIYCDLGSDLIIRGCAFRDNRAFCGGGGVAIRESSPTIIGSEFSDNRGSIACGGSSGVACVGGSPQILDCSFINGRETALNLNGAGTPLIRGCLFVGNSGEINGAIVTRSRATIERCRFVNNRAFYFSGAVECLAPTLILNCEFLGNSCTLQGGGALSIGGGTIVRNCTFVGNVGGVSFGAGAIYYWGGSPDPVIENNIFWQNRDDQIGYFDNPLRVTYSLVQDGWPGEGNIDLDPRFVDQANGDLHLLADSPAIDAGDPALIPSPGETDIDGHKRIWNGRVDMGSDEFGSFPFGDLNCDERFDAFDIEPFLVALIDPDEYRERFPDCDINLGDINGDGSVNSFDIEPFLDLLFGP